MISALTAEIVWEKCILIIITKKPIPMPRDRLFSKCLNYRSGTMRSATMFITLIIGFIAGPAVSL